MFDLNSKTISKRLLMIAALPAAAAILFASATLVALICSRIEATKLVNGTELAVQLGNLVHDLQKERGFSAGFTSSKGRKFASELPVQRTRTDQQLARLKAETNVNEVKDSVARVEQLGTLRSEIDNRALTVPALASRYTAMVEGLLNGIEHQVTSNTSNAEAKAQAAYIQVVRGKEAAGLERAMGATGFGSGRFSPDIYRSFTGVIAVQDAAFKRLRELLTGDQRAELDALLSDENGQTVQKYRAAAFAAATSGQAVDLDPAIWWNATTARIDALKDFENGLALSMIDDAKASRTNSDILLLATTLLLTAMGAALFVLVRHITESITTPLQLIRTSTEAIARGELEKKSAIVSGDNEVAELARSISSLRAQLLAAEAAKQAQTDLIVDSIGTGLDALAEGKLTHRVTEDLSGPFASLKTNFNMASENLCALIGMTLKSAEAIGTGSREIRQASTDLARRTENSAATLEETTAALVEVDGLVKATASSSAETLNRAVDAIETVTRGRAVTNDAVNAMGAVSDSARDIDSVIEGLDKIAFQTRVLAMNAAVEAGRAGEAGRGFAVVADLVSALAMRAEEEAKRAREQLTVTQTGIAAAVGAVQNVDESLNVIAEGVSAVHRLIDRMTEHNSAQSGSLSQITNAVGEIDSATQQNAAMVEQTSAAATNLATEAELLVSYAHRFDVGNGHEKQSASKLPRAGAVGQTRSADAFAA